MCMLVRLVLVPVGLLNILLNVLWNYINNSSSFPYCDRMLYLLCCIVTWTIPLTSLLSGWFHISHLFLRCRNEIITLPHLFMPLHNLKKEVTQSGKIFSLNRNFTKVSIEHQWVFKNMLSVKTFWKYCLSLPKGVSGYSNFK